VSSDSVTDSVYSVTGHDKFIVFIGL
jgi:hypothetical protein